MEGFNITTAVTMSLSRNKAGRSKDVHRTRGMPRRRVDTVQDSSKQRVWRWPTADDCTTKNAQCTVDNDPRPSCYSLNRGYKRLHTDAGRTTPTPRRQSLRLVLVSPRKFFRFLVAWIMDYHQYQLKHWVYSFLVEYYITITYS